MRSRMATKSPNSLLLSPRHSPPFPPPRTLPEAPSSRHSAVKHDFIATQIDSTRAPDASPFTPGEPMVRQCPPSNISPLPIQAIILPVRSSDERHSSLLDRCLDENSQRRRRAGVACTQRKSVIQGIFHSLVNPFSPFFRCISSGRPPPL